jgi:hypothetical protein
VLSHELNHGYKFLPTPVETFNGAPVHNLAHLAAMVDESLGAANGGAAGGSTAAAAADGTAAGGTDEPQQQQYLNFGLEGGRFITLNREQVRECVSVCWCSNQTRKHSQSLCWLHWCGDEHANTHTQLLPPLLQQTLEASPHILRVNINSG